MPIRSGRRSGGERVAANVENTGEGENSRFKKMVNFVQNVTSVKERLFLKPPQLKKRGKRNPYEKKRKMGSSNTVNAILLCKVKDQQDLNKKIYT